MLGKSSFKLVFKPGRRWQWNILQVHSKITPDSSAVGNVSLEFMQHKTDGVARNTESVGDVIARVIAAVNLGTTSLIQTHGQQYTHTVIGGLHWIK